jgi:hypothetical protein
MSPATNSLHNVHGDSPWDFIVHLQYSAFHNDDSPLGFGNFQKGEQVLSRRPVWNSNLNTL